MNDDQHLSGLWQRVRSQFRQTVFDDDFYADFRSPAHPELAKFATWCPKEATYRFFLNFLFNLVRNKPDSFFESYRRIGRTDFGGPLSVAVKGTRVNLDYFVSVEEYDFLDSSLDFGEVRTVAEIGTGYGRTAHALLKLASGIEAYYAVDLPETWDLFTGYMSRVAPELLPKVQFVDYRDVQARKALRPDLAFNVDGFHAMTQPTVDLYKTTLLSKSRFVYVKNAVCKYAPEALGIETPVPPDIFENGYMTEIGDMFDDDGLGMFRALYAERYKPSEHHRVLNQQPSESFGYFQLVLYGP